MRIVAADGLEAMTVAKVASAADYTPGALYRYFKSKDALVAELNRRVLLDHQALLERTMLLAADRASERAIDAPWLTIMPVVCGSAAFRAAARTRPTEFILISTTMGIGRQLVPNPEEATHVPVLNAILENIGTRVQAATEAGLFHEGPTRDRAMALFFGLLGTLQTHKLERFDSSLSADRLAYLLTTDVLTGWGAPRADVEACQSLVDSIINDALGADE